MRDFQVKRDELSSTQLMDGQNAEASSGEVVLRVDRFALTANNITYGVAGDIIGYWQFFPAQDGWGRIPVWGTGTVVTSDHPDVSVGSRYYGYFPMSDFLVVKPEKNSVRGFTDGSAHRAELPVVYNQYSTFAEENGYVLDYENHYLLYRPLFTTSFVLDDFFADNEFFGASTIILGSASSKTAFGLAFLLAQRTDIRVVGLTSKNNVAFVKGLGLYHDVLSYDDIGKLAVEPSAYIDMSGNREVLAQVHHHLDENLLNSCGVGATHWEARDGADPKTLPGAKPTMFFAPTQIVKRSGELGPQVYQEMIATASKAFFDAADQWVNIEEHSFSKVGEVYDIVLNNPSPDRGYIVVNDA